MANIMFEKISQTPFNSAEIKHFQAHKFMNNKIIFTFEHTYWLN
jgi:hypothetical protein